MKYKWFGPNLFIAYFVQEYFECVHWLIAAIIYSNVQINRLSRNKRADGHSNSDVQWFGLIAAQHPKRKKHFPFFNR